MHDLCAATLTLALLVPPVFAADGTTSVDDGDFAISNSGDETTLHADHTADSSAMSMFLLSLDGHATFLTSPPFHQLFLGGGPNGPYEGIVLIRDDDGGTTTVDLNGRTGAIRLGGNNERGELIVHDDSDVETARINGISGTFTNALGGDGLVKAWARINSDGTIVSCWRCNPLQTERFGTGFYRVNFAVLGNGIHGRPRSAVLDSHSTISQDPAVIQTWDSPISTSSISVYIADTSGGADRDFTLIVH